MEKTITINSVKFAPTKTGKDKYNIETSDGNMSVWDSKLAEKLNKRIGQRVSAEIRPAPEGSNYMPTITDTNDASEGTVEAEGLIEMTKDNMERPKPVRKSVKGTAFEKDPVGLAVEVFCALRLKSEAVDHYVMESATVLVKQAQEAFNG